MPLNMTKIAYGAKSWDDLAGWFSGRAEVRLTTRYLPKRHEEMAGGSLFWILDHTLVARSPILGFSQAPGGRWHIDLAPDLIRVEPRPKRAHQGWRYLAADDAPRDLNADELASDVLPARVVKELAKLGLV